MEFPITGDVGSKGNGAFDSKANTISSRPPALCLAKPVESPKSAT
jgi:hypothetical protein